jgi:hypothetical protein
MLLGRNDRIRLVLEKVEEKVGIFRDARVHEGPNVAVRVGVPKDPPTRLVEPDPVQNLLQHGLGQLLGDVKVLKIDVPPERLQQRQKSDGVDPVLVQRELLQAGHLGNALGEVLRPRVREAAPSQAEAPEVAVLLQRHGNSSGPVVANGVEGQIQLLEARVEPEHVGEGAGTGVVHSVVAHVESLEDARAVREAPRKG